MPQHYGAMPLKPAFEDSKAVYYNELHLQRYTMHDLVEKALLGNINCREWLGYDISRRAPVIVPAGYVWNPRYQVLVPPGFSYCTACKRVHPLSEFRVDERRKGRASIRSKCRKWEADSQTPRNRKKARQLYEKKWKRG